MCGQEWSGVRFHQMDREKMGLQKENKHNRQKPMLSRTLLRAFIPPRVRQPSTSICLRAFSKVFLGSPETMTEKLVQKCSTSMWDNSECVWQNAGSQPGNFVPQGACDNVQRHFWLSQLGERECQDIYDQRPGMLLNIPQYSGKPPKRGIIQPKITIMPRLKEIED